MPLFVCAEPGCATPATCRGRCDEHRKALERERSRQRRADPGKGTRIKLYHSKKWAMTRKAVLARDPLCQDGRVCGGEALSTEVDHIVPLGQGGAPWDVENLQGICGPCHVRKSGAEGRAA